MTIASDLIDLRLAVAAELRELRDEIAALSEAVNDRPRRTIETHEGPDSLEGQVRDLYNVLADWRVEEARKQGFDAYRVFSNRLLAEIARVRPADKFALSNIKGVGPNKTEQYGDAVLAIVTLDSW